jgi:hypothetical protein
MANRSLKNHAAFEAGNRAAAEIIGDVAKYGGEEALVVLWARQVLQSGDKPGRGTQGARRPRASRPD